MLTVEDLRGYPGAGGANQKTGKTRGGARRGEGVKEVIKVTRLNEGGQSSRKNLGSKLQKHSNGQPIFEIYTRAVGKCKKGEQ